MGLAVKVRPTELLLLHPCLVENPQLHHHLEPCTDYRPI